MECLWQPAQAGLSVNQHWSSACEKKAAYYTLKLNIFPVSHAPIEAYVHWSSNDAYVVGNYEINQVGCGYLIKLEAKLIFQNAFFFLLFCYSGHWFFQKH